MSILGKLLIVFNLLAAAAFTYVTLDNWKVRKDLTRAAFVRDIHLNGVPVEDHPVAGLDADYAPFRRDINNLPYESAPKETIDAAIPPGDEIFGGGKVYNQTDEVKRVQKQVFAHIGSAAGNDANLKFQWLRSYLLALARTGAERDGVNAIFDMRDQTRSYGARRDLPLAARSESQTAALRALVEVADLGADPAALPETVRAGKIAAAREAIRRFARGEIAVRSGTTDTRSQEWTGLANAVENAFERQGEAEKNAAASSAKDKDFASVAAALVEPLADRASADRAAAALVAYAVAKKGTDTEGAGVTALANLIRPPVQGFNLDAEVTAAAENLLNARFDDAAQPAKAAAGADPTAEKARKIAHLLYHIDGWRYADPRSADARKTWHTRVASIVGLPAYIRAAEAQATEYAEAAQRLTALITDEQSGFEAAYQAQVQKVLFLYSQWLALDSQLRAQNAITAENERLMNERKTERDNLLKELAQAREDAKTMLAKLKKTQQDLFAIQKDLRDAQEALLVLEQELRKLELRDEAARK